MPRTGNNISIEFPVHIAGEIDGVVYQKHKNKPAEPLANIILALYKTSGELERRTLTGPDGFYILSLIPPGDYYMIVEDKNVPKDFARPPLKRIRIEYDGTVIYGNDIFLTEGKPDVPTKILTAKTFNENDKDFPETKDGMAVVLNLGTFKSKLSMAYTWHKLKKNFGPYLGGGHLLEHPSESRSDKASGLHNLRVVLPENKLSPAYQRCQALKKRQAFCAVEIVSTTM